MIMCVKGKPVLLNLEDAVSTIPVFTCYSIINEELPSALRSASGVTDRGKLN